MTRTKVDLTQFEGMTDDECSEIQSRADYWREVKNRNSAEVSEILYSELREVTREHGLRVLRWAEMASRTPALIQDLTETRRELAEAVGLLRSIQKEGLTAHTHHYADISAFLAQIEVE